MLDPLPIADAASVVDLWRWLVGLWIFAIGASIGSFLNVVVYRLPRGLSIVHPPSHCPACHRPIRPYDNLPVASYLLLRGRCRDCGARFSPRYALVELGAGLVLLGVAATGPLFRYHSLAELLDFAGAAIAWGELAFLAALLAPLWSAALIACDEQRPPPRLIAVPLVVGLVCGAIWPQLIAIPAGAMLDFPDATAAISPTATGSLGAIVGATLVAVWHVIAVPRNPNANSLLKKGTDPLRHVVICGHNRTFQRVCPLFQLAASAALCPKSWNAAWAAVAGLFLGWQATLLAVALAAATMALVSVIAARHKSLGERAGGVWLAHFALAATLTALARHAVPSLAIHNARAWPPIALAVAVVICGAIIAALRSRSASRPRA